MVLFLSHEVCSSRVCDFSRRLWLSVRRHQEISGRRQTPCTAKARPRVPVCWLWRTAGAWSLTKEVNFSRLNEVGSVSTVTKTGSSTAGSSWTAGLWVGFHLKPLLFMVKYLEKHSNDLFWDPDKNLSCASEAPHDFKCASSQSPLLVLRDHSGVYHLARPARGHHTSS